MNSDLLHEHIGPRGVDPDKVWYFNRDHAWFAGYAPARSPEIAIVVIIEHGGGGSKVAAPIARDMLLAAQKLDSLRIASQRPVVPARPDETA